MAIDRRAAERDFGDEPEGRGARVERGGEDERGGNIGVSPGAEAGANRAAKDADDFALHVEERPASGVVSGRRIAVDSFAERRRVLGAGDVHTADLAGAGLLGIENDDAFADLKLPFGIPDEGRGIAQRFRNQV